MLCFFICVALSVVTGFVFGSLIYEDFSSGLLAWFVSFIIIMLLAFLISVIVFDIKYDYVIYEEIISFEETNIINQIDVFGDETIFYKIKENDISFKKYADFKKVVKDPNGKRYLIYQIIKHGKSNRFLFNLESTITDKYIFVGDLKDFEKNIIVE